MEHLTSPTAGRLLQHLPIDHNRPVAVHSENVFSGVLMSSSHLPPQVPFHSAANSRPSGVLTAQSPATVGQPPYPAVIEYLIDLVFVHVSNSAFGVWRLAGVAGDLGRSHEEVK